MKILLGSFKAKLGEKTDNWKW